MVDRTPSRSLPQLCRKPSLAAVCDVARYTFGHRVSGSLVTVNTNRLLASGASNALPCAFHRRNLRLDRIRSELFSKLRCFFLQSGSRLHRWPGRACLQCQTKPDRSDESSWPRRSFQSLPPEKCSVRRQTLVVIGSVVLSATTSAEQRMAWSSVISLTGSPEIGTPDPPWDSEAEEKTKS